MVYVSTKILPWLISVLCFLLLKALLPVRIQAMPLLRLTERKQINYFPQISIDYHILWSIIKDRNMIIFSYRFFYNSETFDYRFL